MELTFLKHIEQYDVEFNRLMYPVHYKVIIKTENMEPVVLTFYKQDDQQWHPDETIETTALANLCVAITGIIETHATAAGHQETG